MQTRKLGFTEFELTTIGMGTFALGGGHWQYAWGEQDDADSIAAIHRAFDLGINWIDTAPAYGMGHAEEIVGRVLKERRENIITATKCGLSWDVDTGEIKRSLNGKTMQQEVEDSLRRLQLDVIDLLQIHWPIPDEKIEEAWSAIAEVIQQGKVRYGGVSNFNLDQMRRAQAIHPIASLQPPYNMLNRGIEDGLLQFCADNNIGVIAYGPMAAGLLAGKFTRERLESLPDNDWRKDNANFTEPEVTANLALVEGLRALAERHNRSTGEVAIAWTLRRPEVTAAIVGARRPSQIEETAPAGDWALSAEDLAEIDGLLAERYSALA